MARPVANVTQSATQNAKFDPNAGVYSAVVGKQYPADLFQPGSTASVVFKIKDAVAQNASVKDYIAMYMPPTIKVQYEAQYEELDMSYLSMTGMTLNDVRGATQGPVLGALGAFGKAAGRSGSSGFDLNAAARGAANLYGSMSNLLGGMTAADAQRQVEIVSGKMVNPHMSLLFRGMGMRTFQFEFQMMARSKAESDAIYNIIKSFKVAMHPGLGAAGFAAARYFIFPDNFDIELYSPEHKYLFKIQTCALVNMEVDYAGSGVPSFFTDTGAPVDIRMSLTFKELAVLTKDKIQNFDY